MMSTVRLDAHKPRCQAGVAGAVEPALLASEARMAQRSQHRVSEGQDFRSERPSEVAWATPARRQ
ncbi:MAG: hypothetical protein ACK5SI_18165 [Planctomycetia bacterium]